MATTGSDATLERLLSLHPKLVDLSLGRMQRLLADLGYPERQLAPVVHVTGTNGKGSVVAFLRAILEAAGLKVHVYTSPHLVRFHERIRLAGELIAEERLQALLDECERVNAGQEITFFEITTAAAFLAFARTPADVVLLENGLGGRLDATNVVARPARTAITPVSLDHQQFLGETLGEIATEKAGIIKPGVPCIVGPQPAAAMDVIAGHAEARGAPLLAWGVNWRARQESDGMVLEFLGEAETLPQPALAGAHQAVNAGHAAALALSLPGAGVGWDHVARGLRDVEWPARLQRLRRGPIVDALPKGWEVWLDGGHNPGAGETIAAFAAERWAGRPLHLLVGMINTKDRAGFLRPLAPLTADARCVTIPDEAAAVSADDLVRAAHDAGIDARAEGDALSAAGAVAAGARPDAPGVLLICGSLYFAGRILAEHG